MGARLFRAAAEVTAYDLIESFTHDQHRKVILAVETRTQTKPGKNQPARPIDDHGGEAAQAAIANQAAFDDAAQHVHVDVAAAQEQGDASAL